jgi:hypothetical protein
MSTGQNLCSPLPKIHPQIVNNRQHATVVNSVQQANFLSDGASNQGTYELSFDLMIVVDTGVMLAQDQPLIFMWLILPGMIRLAPT